MKRAVSHHCIQNSAFDLNSAKQPLFLCGALLNGCSCVCALRERLCCNLGLLDFSCWTNVCGEVLLWVFLCSFLFVILHLALNTDVYAYI